VTKYAIIGGSVGGIGAVEAIRGVDPIGDITVISDEAFPQYSRPMIAEFLCEDTTLEKMKYRNDQLWENYNVQALTGKRAVSLNLIDKYVTLEGEDKIDFDKLLIATGGKPFVPKIDGIEKDGVFTFTTLSDAKRIMKEIRSARRALIVGGGLIGVSIAEALNKCGVKGIIVELKDRILNLILDETASEIVEKVIEKAGVTIITGQTVKQIVGRSHNDGVVGGVVLTNGTEMVCDLVIIAIGVVPRTEIVLGTKVKVNRGIVVDRFMCTNVPDVYACGDVAEAYDFVMDESRLLPLWPIAYQGGKVAGYNMAGKKTEYPGGMAMNALKYFDTPIISVGITNPTVDDSYEIIVEQDLERGLYKKIVLKNGIIIGMIFIGNIERAGIISHLIKNRVNVESFKHKLLSEDFGLISIPKKLRKILWVN
jgi:NAD(P)H-nitrite reductase large subunit